jgi:hypothetical protein
MFTAISSNFFNPFGFNIRNPKAKGFEIESRVDHLADFAEGRAGTVTCPACHLI